MGKIYLRTSQEIKKFLKEHATEYNLDSCVRNNGLYLINNVEFGGRVPNFLIDEYDIKYFNNILDMLNLNKPPPVSDEYNYLINTVIEKMIQWIQKRLNTSVMFNYNYWDFLNKLYSEDCFKKSFKSLVSSSKTDTNIRNIFFGDCREHEVFLHVLLKLYLKRHDLDKKYKIYKFYGYGTTITNTKDNIKYWKKKQNVSRGGSRTLAAMTRSSSSSLKIPFPSIENINITTWEHTHPLLYIEESNTLIALDALCHKTPIYPEIEENHNIILKIEATPITTKTDEYTYTSWYSNLEDISSRIYTESPTPYSKNIPYTTVNRKSPEGKIFGYKFKKEKLLKSPFYNEDLQYLDLTKLKKDELFYTGIKTLCLNDSSLSSKR